MDEQDWRSSAVDAVTYPVSLQLQVLGIPGIRDLLRHPPKHDRRRDKHDQKNQYYKNDIHRLDNNPTCGLGQLRDRS